MKEKDAVYSESLGLKPKEHYQVVSKFIREICRAAYQCFICLIGCYLFLFYSVSFLLCLFVVLFSQSSLFLLPDAGSKNIRNALPSLYCVSDHGSRKYHSSKNTHLIQEQSQNLPLFPLSWVVGEVSWEPQSTRSIGPHRTNLLKSLSSPRWADVDLGHMISTQSPISSRGKTEKACDYGTCETG